MQSTYEAEKIFKYLNEGIIILNKEKSVLYCNPSVTTHFEENIQGKDIREWMIDNDLINEYISEDASESIKISFKKKNGEILTTKCHIMQEIYLGQDATAIIIQRYDYAEVEWEVAKSILNKMPYMIMIEECKSDYVYLNDVTKWLIKNITGKSIVSKEAERSVSGRVWNNYIAKGQWNRDNELLEKQGGLYAERSITANNQIYNYSLFKWGICNKENRLEKIVTIGTADLYTRKCVEDKDEAQKERVIKPTKDSVFNSHFLGSMLGAESFHICLYDEQKQKLEILSEVEEDFDEGETINDAYMTEDEYRSFANTEQNYTIEEFEQAFHCKLPIMWRRQKIKWVKKCPLKLETEILGIVIMTFKDDIEAIFPSRQILNYICNDIAFIVKNIQLTKCIQREFASRQAIEEDLKVCLDIAMDSCIICDKDFNKDR